MRRVLVTGLVLVLLSACAGPNDEAAELSAADAARVPLGELEVLADPQSYVGSSVARLVGFPIEPLVPGAQELPATVKSYNRGQASSVTITKTSRVIAMDSAGAIATTIYALGFGDSLVGRDISTDLPGTADLPVITSTGHSINAEAVLSLRPDLVITDGSIGPRDVVEQLSDAGVTVVFVKNTRSFSGAEELARHVGDIFGVPSAGAELANRIGNDIDATISEIASIAPKNADKKLSMMFLYIRGQSGIYYMFGEESGASDLISGLGGIDVAKKLGWTQMQPMTDEAMVAANPDLILVMSKGLDSTDGVEGLLAARPAIALTNAGKNKRIVSMDDNDVLTFGPRTAAVLDALARAIYAPGSP